VGDLLKPPLWGDPETPYRILYDSTFFFIVIVILLNIIFGIIIDTFGGTSLPHTHTLSLSLAFSLQSA
jgi:hypothetical protein